jgi:hypothetical protein
MKIAYIDPGLTCRKGHNAAMVEEFDQALVTERGHRVTYLCAANTDAKAFDNLRGKLRPTFRIDGYAKPDHADLFDSQRFDRIAAVMAQDLARADALTDCDAILMPTAYPLHLHALAQRAASLSARRVVLGLLLPSSFWSSDVQSERRVSELFATAINAFSSATDLFAYSETGVFQFGDNPVSLATLLPPLARSSAEQVRRLCANEERAVAPVSPILGFFGSPFTGKGFGLLTDAALELAGRDVRPVSRLVIRLPHGHEDACRHLNAMAPWVDATSRTMTNEEYLAEMAAVDAVCAFYDPQQYGTKMSGIVPEAISLGKPLLITEGCHAIQDFLERHAPSSFLCGRYETQTLTDVLSLPADVWARPGACARSHAPLMQQLKSMERYLAVCGLD